MSVVVVLLVLVLLQFRVLGLMARKNAGIGGSTRSGYHIERLRRAEVGTAGFFADGG